MKRCLTAAVVAALVAASPALAYDEDDDDVEEVVVTADRLDNLLNPYGAMSEVELQFYQERAQQTANALVAACERAKQDAISAGATAAGATWTASRCSHISSGRAKTVCTMAVAAAAAMCAFGSSSGPSGN